MAILQRILKITVYFLCILLKTDCIQYTVIGGLTSDALPCNKSVILKCNAQPDSFSVRWHIGYNAQLTSRVSAVCDETTCKVFDNFSNRYTLTYDKPSGLSNLTINRVTSDDNNRGYICNNFQNPLTFTATVKSFPTNDTTKIKADEGQKMVTVSTGCTLNIGKVTFSWFYLKDGDKTARSFIENTTATEDVCTSSSACNGTSLKSSINISAPESIGEKFSIQCNIIFSDPDVPGPVIKILDDVITSGDENAKQSETDMRTGALVGGTSIGIVFIALAAVVMIFIVRRRKPFARGEDSVKGSIHQNLRLDQHPVTKMDRKSSDKTQADSKPSTDREDSTQSQQQPKQRQQQQQQAVQQNKCMLCPDSDHIPDSVGFCSTCDARVCTDCYFDHRQMHHVLI